MAAAAQQRRRFDPVGTLPPSADVAPAAPVDPPPTPAAEATKPTRAPTAKTSRRQDVVTPEARLAYTWRLDRDQYQQLERFTGIVRDAAGRIKLDRAEMLAALLDQLDDDPAYAKKVARRLN